MTNLTEYLKSKNIEKLEGYSQQVPEQVDFLKTLVSNPSIKNVMEIGFNAGHSAEIFLSENENIHLVSFDLNYHDYVKIGKQYIDETYPGRHTLITGNSNITVPEYCETNIDKKFDIIFIDGNHVYPVPMNDIFNCLPLAHKETILIMDDIIKTETWIKTWNVGPNRAWKECLELGLIREIGHKDCTKGRGYSWGYYDFDGIMIRKDANGIKVLKLWKI